MSLRAQILAVVAALNLLLLAAVGVSLAEALRDRAAAQQAQSVNQTADLLLWSLSHWGAERATTAVAFAAPGPAAAETTQALEIRRLNADVGASEAVAALAEDPRRAELRRALDGAVQALTAARGPLDQALSQPAAARAAATGDAYQTAAANAVAAARAAQSAVAADRLGFDPNLSSLLELKRAVAAAAEASARERTILGAALAAQRGLSAEERDAAAVSRGQMEQAWASVASLSRESWASAEVVAAVRAAETTMRDFAPLRRAALTGTATLDAAAFDASAAAVGDALLNIQEASIAGAKAYAQSLADRATTRSALMAGLALLGLGLFAASLWIALARVFRPLAGLGGAMTHLAAGDLATAIPGLGRRDEIGAMAGCVAVFRDQAEAKRALERQAEQDRRAADTARRAALSDTAARLEAEVSGVVDALAAAAEQLGQSAVGLTGDAERASRQSRAAAEASATSVENVQNVAAAAEELSASISEIARQSERAADVAERAVSEAQDASRSAVGLSEAAGRIGAVVKLIGDIAGQTNLLALNATIEAARAGEAGKGFAVVAGEVKSLANQTARATGEITDQIAAMQAATQEVAQAIAGVGDTIRQIHDVAAEIEGSLTGQGAATRDIAANVAQAAAGAQRVAQAISGVDALADRTGSSAGDLLGAAKDLERQSGKLSDDVRRVAADLRRG